MRQEMGLYQIFKSLAFRGDPEFVHHWTIKLLAQAPALAYLWSLDGSSERSLKSGWSEGAGRFSVRLGDLVWPFPLGLAAGLDKNGECVGFFSKLPLGAVEVGSVTPRPQAGNPRPRLFRYPEEESLRNKMGFNNQGADQVYKNLWPYHLREQRGGRLLGVNLGKNKDTPLEKSVEDYLILYRKFAPLADYLVINVSSPNTPGLRSLQTVEFLQELLQGLADERKVRATPLYLKVAPELDLRELDKILSVARSSGLAGIIATNTSVDARYGEGGLSGRLLREKARQMRREVLVRVGRDPHFQVIGVGGISSFEDLWEFWQLGGKCVQIYTAFIFQGPGLFVDIIRRIDQVLEQTGLRTVEQLLEQMPLLKKDSLKDIPLPRH